MQFNLIDERWIPVKRRDGSSDKIAPWQVTDGFAENPIVSLNAPRPDFNGALIQFLIGLVQTTFAPANPIEWKKKLQTPPTPDQLKAIFMKVHDVFELAGNGPRFMQDHQDIKADCGAIDGLLIDTPGDNTLKKNLDHFVKRSIVRSMCHSCCATALFTMQTNAPAGGQGYRTSLRGGGPLTTLVIGDRCFDTLWHTIWLNVLESATFLNMCNAKKRSSEDMFPWLAKTRRASTEQDIHPAHYFWAMPRRIRLNLEDLSPGTCSICSIQGDRVIVSYREVNRGTEYKAPMRHPLSAFDKRVINGKAKNKAVLTQPGGVSYRHWLGLVTKDAKGEVEPATTVDKFINNNRLQSGQQFRLWAFGYDMDNMKARCWYEARIPLLHLATSIREEYEQIVAGMVSAASEIAGNVRSAVKNAWFRRPGDVKGDTSFMGLTFWQNTEPHFYKTLNSLKNALESEQDSLAIRTAWHKVLCVEALRIFDANAWNGPIEDADPRRTAIARKELRFYNNGRKIKGLLGLPMGKATIVKKDTEISPRRSES